MTIYEEVFYDLKIYPGAEFRRIDNQAKLSDLVRERRDRIGRAAAELVNAIGYVKDDESNRIRSVALGVDSIVVERFVMPLEVEEDGTLLTETETMPIPVSHYVSERSNR